MTKEKILNWLKPILAGILLLALSVWAKGVFKAENAKTMFRLLSDSFVIPGILLCGVSAISWAGTEGAFDMLAYGSKTFMSLFSRSYAQKLPKTYYDYKQQLEEKNRQWLKRTLVVGAVFLAIGGLLLIPYSKCN